MPKFEATRLVMRLFKFWASKIDFGRIISPNLMPSSKWTGNKLWKWGLVFIFIYLKATIMLSKTRFDCSATLREVKRKKERKKEKKTVYDL